MQLGNFSTHRNAQLGVEVGQRFVHQEDLRFANDGAAEGNTLTLAAGQSLRLTVEQVFDIEDLRRFMHALVDLRLGGLAQLEAERHVIVNRHVRIQSVVLEHHRDVAILRGDVVDELVGDVEFAVADFFQAGHHAQGGGLTATGRADENDKFLILDIQAEVADRGHTAGVHFVDVLQGYACH